jgi:alpha-beta hydrolase superfamily lysophospholipase
MKNPVKPEIASNDSGRFYTVSDDCQLFIYDYQPNANYTSTIVVISGITGINHNSEKDLIEFLSNNEHRIVVIHPRGTGYSEGKRGDIAHFDRFVADYTEIISHDKDYDSPEHGLFLFGHSMSTAVLLASADNLRNISGAVLVNPPLIQKAAKGMSPGVGDYIKYACYYIFARHKPIVNMAGDPSKIENEDDRKESEQRLKDSLLVKYFSLYFMNESRKLMNKMPYYSGKANYPLLLVYGMKDNIVDKKGCDSIYSSWKNPNKKYLLIENGSHGKSTVALASGEIRRWIKENYAG